MFERFAQDARRVVVDAQEQARDLGHNYIGTEHLLLGVVVQPPSVPASRALRALGYSTESCRTAIEEIIGPGEPIRSTGGHIPFTPRCKKVLELSLRESQRLRHGQITAGHIVLALLDEGGGVAAKVLVQHGPTLNAVRTAILAVTRDAAGEPAPARTPAVDEVLALAERLAAGAPVGSHHLLEALVRSGPTMGGQALAALGLDADAIVDQVDAQDLSGTSDVTPEQLGAGRTRLWVEGDELRVAVTDSALAERARGLVTAAGGELTGDGPLVGPFVGLHRGIIDGLDALAAVLVPTEPGDNETPHRSVADRLRRRRPGR